MSNMSSIVASSEARRKKTSLELPWALAKKMMLAAKIQDSTFKKEVTLAIREYLERRNLDPDSLAN